MKKAADASSKGQNTTDVAEILSLAGNGLEGLLRGLGAVSTTRNGTRMTRIFADFSG